MKTGSVRKRLWSFLICSAAAVASGQTNRPQTQPNPDAIRAHMRFLADDLLEGRGLGTRGEELAAAYIVAQFELMGLKPGGLDGSYYQSVPLVQAIASNEGSFSVSTRAGVEGLLFGTDYIPLPGFTAAVRQLAAPVAFVGFGIVAPERKLDAYAGLDVHGKIVLALSGAPKNLPSEERAFYSSMQLKQEEAARHGASGVVILYTPTMEAVAPFARAARAWQEPRATWVDAAGEAFAPGSPLLAIVGLAGGRKLLANAPMSFDNVMRAADGQDGKVRSFTLPLTASIANHSRISPVRSANLLGVVPGSDDHMKNQYIVLSAHYDHLGIGAPVGADAIYNGALDNAAGVAVLLETARALLQPGQKPGRSVLFAIVTAEESGLVGSDYFARHPTVPRAAIVSDINVDMPLLTYDFVDVVAFGGPHSTLGPIVNESAAQIGVRSSPDPVPDEAVFIRSDHYRFVQQGIPAITIATGFDGPGRAAYEDYLEHRYHQPGDDLTQPIDYVAGAKLVRLLSATTLIIGAREQPPSWNQGDFFGTRFH
jgi:Zn-dependent M28 family amino/carboxypeptidase